MGVSSCFLTPLKTLRLACTAATMTTGHFFLSLYCLPICNNILYCFLNHKQHRGRKKPLALLFISVWQMKMCGGGEPTGRELFFFDATISKHILHIFVLFCALIQPMNIYEICNVLWKNKIRSLKLCMRVQNWICLRRAYHFSSKDLGYWLKRLTHSHWTHFSSGNIYFHPKDSESRHLL